MKRTLILPALLWACGGGEAAKMDSTPAAPPPLAASDLTGTYAGTTTVEVGDSVIGTWSSVVTSGTSGIAGRFVDAANPKDTVAFTQTISGDSVISSSTPYTDPAAPKGTGQMQWTGVGRATGMEWSGTVSIKLAGTDSVVQRARWKATRTP